MQISTKCRLITEAFWTTRFSVGSLPYGTFFLLFWFLLQFAERCVCVSGPLDPKPLQEAWFTPLFPSASAGAWGASQDVSVNE